ncbi:hypothetical protein PTKIN_Ptkin03bG0140900 [Pterospermum kingtungense]
MGVVIRDKEGLFVGATHLDTEDILVAQIIEPYVAEKAMKLTSDLGVLRLTNIIVEGDAAGVVKAINSIQLDLAPIRNIIEKARHRRNSFSKCKILHIRRQANMSTHTLAHLALLQRQKGCEVRGLPKGYPRYCCE